MSFPNFSVNLGVQTVPVFFIIVPKPKFAEKKKKHRKLGKIRKSLVCSAAFVNILWIYFKKLYTLVAILYVRTVTKNCNGP